MAQRNKTQDESRVIDGAPTASHEAAVQLAGEINEDNDGQADDDEQANPSLLEKMDHEMVRRATHRYERLLQRRAKRHSFEFAVVEDMQQTISARQVELVALQATADATAAEMQGFKDTVA